MDNRTTIKATLNTTIPLSLFATTTSIANTTEAAPLKPAQETKSFCPLLDFIGLIKA